MRPYRAIRPALTVLACCCLVSIAHTVEMVHLTDLQPTEARDRSGKDPFRKNGSILVNQAPKESDLAIGDRQYERGLFFTESKQSVSYELDGQYSGFTFDIGLLKNGPVGFDVLGDGNYLYQSGSLHDGDHHAVVLDVSMVEQLTLVVDRLDNLKTHVVLGRPYLIPQPQLPERKQGKAGNTAPKAVITSDVQEGRVPLTVRFDGSESSDPDDAVYLYQWQFGDGQQENLASDPTHTYEQPGVYRVILEAADNDGGVGVSSTLIKVNPTDNLAPIARITASQRLAKPPASISFSAESSEDVDGEVVSYAWRFSDGSTADGPTVSRQYDETGFSTAELTVTDNNTGRYLCGDTDLTMAAAWDASKFIWKPQGDDAPQRGPHWRHRPDPDMPFFQMFNIVSTHESYLFPEMREETPRHDPAAVILTPYHQDTPMAREDWAYFLDRLEEMDTQVGGVFKYLAEDNELDDSIVFYFADHGGNMMRSKRHLQDSGTHVPLII